MSTTNEIEKAVAELNQRYAFVDNNGAALIIKETPLAGSQQLKISFCTLQSRLHTYANDTVLDKDRRRTKAEIWMQSPQRRQYEDIVFNPKWCGNPYATKDDPRPYNMWQGFAVEPRPGDCHLFTEHVNEVICSNIPEYSCYFWDWLADMFQNPGGDIPEVAPVLKGDKGCGKGTFFDAITALLGVHALHVHGAKQLLGRFNGHMAEKICILADEALWQQKNKQVEGVLKGMITDKQIAIEKKGIDTIYVDNHIRIIFASNDDGVVPATLGERRFFVLDCSPKHVGDTPYFGAIREELKNGGLQALLHNLLHREIKSNLRLAPKTVGLWDEITRSFSPEMAFFLHLLETDILTDEPQEIKKTTVYTEYANFVRNSRVSKSQTVFSRCVKDAFPGIQDRRIMDDGRRFWVWDAPCRDEARKMFLAGCGWTGPSPWGGNSGN